MAEDRNSLLGLIAVRKGWAQPADVLAAQTQLRVKPEGSLAEELIAAGVLSRDRAVDLELLCGKALANAGGSVQGAIEAHGGLQSLALTGQDLPFVRGDDDEPTRLGRPASEEDVETGASKPVSFGDDDDEPTSIKLDLPTLSAEPAPKSFDDDDEPTKVLDWDRATRKAVENFSVDDPAPRKK